MQAVDEPALVAVIGVGGIVVGAVGTGIVQYFLARFDRRRSGHAAARVLAGELHEAEYATSELLPRRDWSQMITDWDSFESAWQQYRDQVTHVLSTDEFTAVDSAFASMRTLSRAAKRDLAKQPPAPGQPPHFDPSEEILARYLQVVQRAKWIVMENSFLWRERESKRRVVANRPAAAATQDLIFPDK
jgi:hypothetical protein